METFDLHHPSFTIVDEDYNDESQVLVSEWGRQAAEDFLASEAAQALSAAAQAEVGFLIDIFTEYCYGYFLEKPGQWSPDSMREMCWDILPRKISSDMQFFELVVPIFDVFLPWAEQAGLMQDVASLLEALHETEAAMLANAKDPECWGMAKSMMMGATGLSLSVIEDVEADVEEITDASGQHKLVHYHLPITSHKVGRNDPCPCGSGKKYKKCCLS